jgi:hypothetical protein
MAGRALQRHRLANRVRGYESSRLDEQWMAAVYALVVPARHGRQRQSPPVLPEQRPTATAARCRSAGGEAR